jgi:hypothetical protein
MKKITTLRGKMFNGILSLTLILIAGFFNSANAQLITLDGERCTGEWLDSNAYVDVDFSNVSQSSNIKRVWFGVDGSMIDFALSRQQGGQTAVAMFFDTDCSSSTGSSANNGAERAVFFNMSSGGGGTWVIDETEIYEWVSTSSSWSVITGKTFNAEVGDSACGGADRNFFEFSVSIPDLVDPCDLGSCGGITLTQAVTYAGSVFNSNQKDELDINKFAFVNDVPVPDIAYDALLCDGVSVELDASASTENNPGNETSYDNVVTYEWDFEYDAVTGFSADATGSPYTTPTLNYDALNQYSTGVTRYTVALMVTDVFGCQDSIVDLHLDIYKKPSVTFAAVTDIDSIGANTCKEFEFTFEGSATDYAGSSFSSLFFRTADGNLGSSSDAGTFGDIEYVYTYGDCRWSSALIGELDKVIAIDPVSGCSDSAVMSPPVPVELISFTGEVIGADAHIKWQTASELNSDYFIVEKSLDGKNYTFVQNITAAGNSSEILDYMIIDPNMEEGNVYYRLTQFDFNGAYEVFDPIVLNKADGQGRIKVSPNPTSDVVNVNIPASKYNGELVILDLAGKQVFSTNVNANVNATSVDIDVAALPKGMYYVRFGNEKEGFTSQMLQLL